MWTPLRQEIERIRKDFELTEKLKPVGLTEWKEVIDKASEKFYKRKTHKYLTGSAGDFLKVESAGFQPDKQPYLLLDKLIDETNDVFLLLNETVNEREKLWVYESTVVPIQTTLAESVWFDEVTIVDKKFNWILCINHHDIIVAGGEEMVEKLKQLKSRLTTE